MSTKTKENLTVVSQEEIGKDIFSLWLQTDQMAQYARPGQFLSLYTGNAGKLLPRPISICEIDKETSRIRRSEEHTSELQSPGGSRMPSSA